MGGMNEAWIMMMAVGVGSGVVGLLVGLGLARVRLAESRAEAERLAGERGFLRRQLEQAEQQKRETVQMLREGFDAARESMAERLREQEERWKEQQQSSEERFRALSTRALADNAQQLKASNLEQLGALLSPLKLRIEGLDKAVQLTNATNASQKASLEELIRQMLDQTRRLDAEATNLSKALKGDNKKQGDWGEMVLERMLESAGLRRDEEYYLQKTYTGEDGRGLRPDVVIRFPDDRCVVVDSKVSLTNYAAYVAAEEEEEREAQLAAHVRSVEQHVEELAEKRYGEVVEGSVGYVLMFMPNEAAYVAAVQRKPELPLLGSERGVLIVSPTNLLMALKLAHHLWQKERQANSIQSIVKKAAGVYEQCCLLQESIEAVGKGLDNAKRYYDEAMKRFSKGRGNLVHRVDELRGMGISPKRQLRAGLPADEE